MLNIKCSSCGGRGNPMRVVKSNIIPTARYITCDDCENQGFEPRSIVVLGSIYPGADEKRAKRHIKYQLYVGDVIRADEII